MLKTASITWKDNGRLYNNDYKDMYFQPDEGMGESDYVFLQANKLIERFAALKKGDVFRIAELGFGTGLNFLMVWALWKKYATKEARLYFISFEKHPILKKDLQKIHSHWQELLDLSEHLLDVYAEPVAGFHSLHFDDVRLMLGFGDVNDLLPQVNTTIDAWFLDGFSPEKNPEMWSNDLFKQMKRLTIKGGSFSTFTAASAVSTGLEAVGFTVKKIDGYGRKRRMFIGSLDKGVFDKSKLPPENIIVIGAGIAGCSVAYSLASRGLSVTILEKKSEIADAASGNIIGVAYPRLTAAPSPFAEFYSHAFFHTGRLLKKLGSATGWKKSGALMLSHDDAMTKKNQGIYKTSGFSETILRYVNAKQASEIAGVEMPWGGLFYPDAGYVAPRKFCKALLDAYPDLITLKTKNSIDKIPHNSIVIIASGAGIGNYKDIEWIPLRYVGGQVSHISATQESSKLKTVIAHKGYIPPAVEGVHYAGSTFKQLDNASNGFLETQDAHLENLEVLSEYLPSLQIKDIPTTGRAEIRTTTPDHLPVIGKVPNLSDWKLDYVGLSMGKIKQSSILLENGSYIPDLYVTGAFGSHGMTSAPLAGEMIAAELTGDPLPITEDARKDVHSGRFILRALRRSTKI